jgi:glutamate N-acetyltransferase/amino-acid N-acetyltransferase
VRGVRLGTACAGIKQLDRDDVVVIELAEASTVAAVFTRNAFCAAPIIVARNNLAQAPRWLIVNSGNANAGTGSRGVRDAEEICGALAALRGGNGEQVLPFSTGVIGEYLPVAKIEAVLPLAIGALSETGWEAAARAIMTTDTRPKLATRRLELDGHGVTITGIAKGAGMIEPNMATMLAFIATDARLPTDISQTCLTEAVDRSFNCITVDGDTSTNDACVLMATGCSRASAIVRDSQPYQEFSRGLQEVCSELAEAIVRDGEGATKFICICVEGADNEHEAQRVARTIAHSPLVKTAFFASDPNWGRILAAIGRSSCPELDVSRISIWLDNVLIVEGGERAKTYTDEAGRAVMEQHDITVRVALGRGSAVRRILTCDFSYDYVRINAEYRT